MVNWPAAQRSNLRDRAAAGKGLTASHLPADPRGRPLDVDRDIGHPYLGNLSPGGSVDHRLVTVGVTQNRVCMKPGMLQWIKS